MTAQSSTLGAMPFKKGVSGNPGGRPKKMEQVIEIEALARKYAPQTMEALVKIATTGKSDSARLRRSSIGLLVGRAKPFGRRTSQTSNTLSRTSLDAGGVAEEISRRKLRSLSECSGLAKKITRSRMMVDLGRLTDVMRSLSIW
jgi:hypothetical protein